MEHTVNALERLYNSKHNLEYLIDKVEEKEISIEDNVLLDGIQGYKDGFIRSMEDDINTADALASVFELVKYTNTEFDENTNKKVIEKAYEIFMELTRVLGILNKGEEILEDEILELIEKRGQARKNKDFKLADEIRDLLKEKGIILEDTQDGVKWKRA